jgi:pimeloyl-ACP methyl ester carboxylesterase
LIKQPVLIVNGENDKLVSSSNSTALKNRIPNSEIILFKDAGHGSIFSTTKSLLKAHRNFLNNRNRKYIQQE